MLVPLAATLAIPLTGLAILTSAHRGHDGRTKAAPARTQNAGTASPGPLAARGLHCDLHAGPAGFGAAVSRAASGQTVCLAGGDYGTWSGTDKPIAVAAAPGVTARMTFSFGAGDAGFTLDGLSGMSGTIEAGAHDITIRNSAFDNTTKIEGVEDGDIVFDHDSFDDIGCDSGCLPRLWLPGPTQEPSGVTVRYSRFRGGSSDGIQAGTALSVIGNEFSHVAHGSCGSCHTDAVQLFSGRAGNGVGSTIKGNYIHDGDTGIVQFDGGGGNVVEDNVIAHMALFGMDFGGDEGTRIVHNTEYAIEGRGLDLTSKPGANSTGEVIEGNILKDIGLADANSSARPAIVAGNLLTSGAAAGPNFTGVPRFVGGAGPVTYLGFRLAAGSPGRGRARGGTDVGIRP